MAWSLSSDVRRFLDAARDYLEARPVDHTVLLTEAAYLAARSSTAADQLYGWWKPDGGAVGGAFLRAPGHSPTLSTMPVAALESLVELVPDLPPMDVDARLGDAAMIAWRDRADIDLSERSRIRLYRLHEPRASLPSTGRPRTATHADRDLLVAWYRRLMAAHPDDPSELAYVIDDPIGYGGITLWEVDGTPMAMAGRSRLIGGMVRLGAVYSPHDGTYGEAAFIAACAAAATVARDVLTFANATDATAEVSYRQLGFEPVLDRVVLAPP